MLPSENLVKVAIPFTGGLDELSQVTAIPLEDALEMENFRLAKDGRRVEKRLGSVDQSLGESVDVFGYHTYYDATPEFCQLAIMETEINRKVAAGSWTSIHTFSSSIAHPVRPLEIQGKQYIINEVDSRMIHTTGSDYQIGIDAPTTLPAGYLSYGTNKFTDGGDDIASWTEAEGGDGDVREVTTEPGTTAHTYRFETVDTVGNAADYASITQDYGTLGDRYKFQFKVYFDTFDGTAVGNNFRAHAQNGSFQFAMYQYRDTNDFYIFDSSSSGTHVGATLAEDTWYTVTAYVDGTTAASANVDLFINGTYYGNFDCSDTDNPGTTGTLQFRQSMHDTSVKARTYVDDITVDESGYSTDAANKYRYAITYGRSGNFGNESNPIKSVVGSANFTGSGIDDLTPGGTYSSSKAITIRIGIIATGTPDQITLSYDNGATTHTDYLPIASIMSLNYGITLTWATTTGHTSGDTWRIPCYPCATNKAVGEQVKLDPLPTSSDAQVDQRKIYRTTADGSTFWWLATINDNTTTVFYDNLPDISLGTQVEEDNDILPDGKFSTWWDNRMWVSGDNIVYYSDVDNPEAFDLDVRYITARKGDKGNAITQMMDYKDALYIFKKNCVFIVIAKPNGGYGRYLINKDFGCIAPWSMIEVNNLLMFMSHRGIELYNGVDSYSLAFSNAVTTTFKAIDKTKLDLISVAHSRATNEVIWSIPDDSSGTTTKSIVYNYIGNKFYLFSRADSEIISCLAEAEDSSYVPQVYVGTRSGKLFLTESTYRDGTSNITATIRKPWIDLSGGTGTGRRLDLHYELPSSMTITANFYRDFDKDVYRASSFTGSTPTATDIEFRRPIKDSCELGKDGRWICFELINNENVGGGLKLNLAEFYYQPKVIKGRKAGD